MSSINPASNPYWSTVEQEAQQYGVSPDLLSVQEYYESGWNPGAVSPNQAFGISQFIPSTAAAYNVQPGTSSAAVTSQIAGQASYMSQLLTKYGGSVQDALAAYNAGPDQANWNNAQTQNYVSEITQALGGSGNSGTTNASLTSVSSSNPLTSSSDPLTSALSQIASPIGSIATRFALIAVGIVVLLVALFGVMESDSQTSVITEGVSNVRERAKQGR